MVKRTNKNIRILIAEDHEIVLYGLKCILELEDDMEVVGCVTTCKETLANAETLNPDVILLDYMLTDGESLDYIARLTEFCPNCKILLFTANSDKKIHLLALRYGAVGILLKTQKTDLICKAIRSVHANDELWVDKTLTAEIWKQNVEITQALEAKSSSSIIDSPSSSVSILSSSTLTSREKQIACLSSKGLSAKKIGEKLSISEKTVRNQLTSIYSKLNVKNQLELTIQSTFLNVCD